MYKVWYKYSRYQGWPSLGSRHYNAAAFRWRAPGRTGAGKRASAGGGFILEIGKFNTSSLFGEQGLKSYRRNHRGLSLSGSSSCCWHEHFHRIKEELSDIGHQVQPLYALKSQDVPTCCSCGLNPPEVLFQTYPRGELLPGWGSSVRASFLLPFCSCP